MFACADGKMNWTNVKLGGFLIILLNFSASHGSHEDNSDDQKREGRVFSLFSIVSFSNAPCRSTSSSSGGTSAFRNGTCFTSNECASKSGTVAGSCASGFGVCCVFIISDVTRTINQNCTYIQNPGFPTALAATNTLQYTIAKCDASVCSLRLDFETFTILGPADTVETTGGICSQDNLVVTVKVENDAIFQTTTSQRIPTICGQNTGQHIYVDIGAVATDTATLAFNFGGTSNARQFEIKVSQIPCGANYAAPSGCLQYVTGLTGRLTTFNFLDATGSSHLAQQQYTQCVRQEQGFCCIQYQVCADANSFTLDNVAAITSLIDSQCTLDYVNIQGGSGNCQVATGVTTTDKFCGNFLNILTGQAANSIVCDCTPPFEVGIFTDNTASANAAISPNRGVCLMYTQLPCN